MELKYEAKKPYRFNYGFAWMTSIDNGWWFDEVLKKWSKNPDYKHELSSCQYCKTVKSFKRKLKKAPNGVRFILVSNWVGYDVEGKGSFND